MFRLDDPADADDCEIKPEALTNRRQAADHVQSSPTDRVSAHTAAVAPLAGKRLIAGSVHEFRGNRVDSGETLCRAMSDGFAHHGLELDIRGEIGEFDDERPVADLVLDCFGDAADQMRVVAQQPVMAFVRAARVHFHELCAGFAYEPCSGHVVGDVLVGVHAGDA